MASDPTLANYISLAALLVLIFGLIIKQSIKLGNIDNIGKNNKEDIDSLKGSRSKMYEDLKLKADKTALDKIENVNKELDSKLDDKVKEIDTKSNLKYVEIFTEISHMRADMRRLPLEIVKLINETKK